MRAMRAAVIVLCVSIVAGCEALDSLVPEPEGQGDLVVTAIRLAEASGTQTAKGKVSTPMRFRVTVKNEGETTMPASMVRLTAQGRVLGGRVLGDLQVPELRPGRDATADGELILASELLGTFDRSQSVSAVVSACANATQTGVEQNSFNNCLSTQGALLIVQPNFELDCGATSVSLGVVLNIASLTKRCDISGSPSSVRFIDVTATTLGAYVLSVQHLDAQVNRDFFFFNVYNEDGTIISSGNEFGAGFRRTFNASVPGRYFIATGANSLYSKTVSRQ